MATRPIRNTLAEGIQAWDADTDTNFELTFDYPFAVRTEDTIGNLNSNFPPADYKDCLVMLNGELYTSDEVTWAPVYPEASNVPDSTATTAEEMAIDFNSLLSALQTAGIMATS